MSFTRAGWQDLFFVQETSNIKSRIDFDEAGTGVGGPGAGPINVLSINPINKANFAFPTKVLSNPKDQEEPTFSLQEVTQGVQNPMTLGYDMLATPNNLRMIFNSFFQGQSLTDLSNETIGDYEYLRKKADFTPYSSADVSEFFATLRALGEFDKTIQDDRKSWEGWGGICSSFGLRGNIGGLINLSSGFAFTRINRSNVLGVISNEPRLDLLGPNGGVPGVTIAIYIESAFPDTWSLLDSSATIVTIDDNFTDPDDLATGTVEISQSTGNLNFSSSALSTFDGRSIAISYLLTGREKLYNELPIDLVEVSPFKFQDLSLLFDTEPLDLISFNLSGSNNPSFKYYDSFYSYQIEIGRMNLTLETVIDWGSADFNGPEALEAYLKGNTHSIVLKWGNDPVTAEGDLVFTMNAIIKSVNIGQDRNVLTSRILFELIKEGSTEPIDISLGYYAGRTFEGITASFNRYEAIVV